MLRKLTVVCVVFIVLSGSIAQATTTPPSVAQPQQTIFDIVRSNTAFALDLYQVIRTEDGNIIMSPYSISSALAMLYLGAGGDTQAQMAATLHLDGPPQFVAEGFGELNGMLPIGDAVEELDYLMPTRLNIANALWVALDYPILRDYVRLLDQYFGAKLETLDFAAAPEEARQTINQWVSDQTEERIPDLMPPGSVAPLTRMVLTNAIYFIAAWQTPFNPDNTRDAPFTLLDGTQVEVPMMVGKYLASAAFTEDYQALELDYQDRGSMIFIVPHDFERFEANFDVQTLAAVKEALVGYYVDITLPRFESETELQLTAALSAMGMTDAFSAEADFSGIVDPGVEPLFVDVVIHKAFINVNEEGTEAAGATALGLGGGPGPEDAPQPFIADRPFIYLITDPRTDSILFMGRVLNPTE